MTCRAILSNCFEEQWTQSYRQYLSGLSRALFSDNLSRNSCIPVCQNEHQQNHILAVQDLKSRFHCLWFREKHRSQGRARDEAKTAETWGIHNSFGQLLLDCRSPVEQLKLNNCEFEILSEAKIAVKDANTNEEISKFPIYVNDPL